MFLTHPSVSLSVSPVFLVSATPLNRSTEFPETVVMKDIMCRCAYPQEIQPEALKHAFIIPHAMSCGGYNVFDPSVSQ